MHGCLLTSHISAAQQTTVPLCDTSTERSPQTDMQSGNPASDLPAQHLMLGSRTNAACPLLCLIIHAATALSGSQATGIRHYYSTEQCDQTKQAHPVRSLTEPKQSGSRKRLPTREVTTAWCHGDSKSVITKATVQYKVHSLYALSATAAQWLW
jgi:hypothetical protein